jgi:hypothetical protein
MNRFPVEEQKIVEVHLLKPVGIAGVHMPAGTVVKVPEEDARQLVGWGRASYSAPDPEAAKQAEEKKRQAALHNGPVEVKILRPCAINGAHVLPGEVAHIPENDADYLAGYRIVERLSPRPKEAEFDAMLEEKVGTIVTKLMGHSKQKDRTN